MTQKFFVISCVYQIKMRFFDTINYLSNKIAEIGFHGGDIKHIERDNANLNGVVPIQQGSLEWHSSLNLENHCVISLRCVCFKC